MNNTKYLIDQFGPLETIAKKNKVELIAISDGDAGSGDPCQAFTHHGFLGVEYGVVNKMKDWIRSGTMSSSDSSNRRNLFEGRH